MCFLQLPLLLLVMRSPKTWIQITRITHANLRCGRSTHLNKLVLDDGEKGDADDDGNDLYDPGEHGRRQDISGSTYGRTGVHIEALRTKCNNSIQRLGTKRIPFALGGTVWSVAVCAWMLRGQIALLLHPYL